MLLRRDRKELGEAEQAAIRYRIMDEEIMFYRSDAEGEELQKECRERKPLAILLPSVTTETERVRLEMICASPIMRLVSSEFPVYAFISHMGQNQTACRMLARVTSAGIFDFNFNKADVRKLFSASPA